MSRKHRTVRSVIATSSFCLILASCTAEAYQKPATSIDDARILVACESQKDVFAGFSQPMDWPGFAERDLLLFDLTHTDLHFISVPARGPVSENEAKQVIRMSDCGADDKYVLIGKDGGVKRRWTGKMSIDELFQTIDAMPMRQYEMRTRGRN